MREINKNWVVLFVIAFFIGAIVSGIINYGIFTTDITELKKEQLELMNEVTELQLELIDLNYSHVIWKEIAIEAEAQLQIEDDYPIDVKYVSLLNRTYLGVETVDSRLFYFNLVQNDWIPTANITQEQPENTDIEWGSVFRLLDWFELLETSSEYQLKGVEYNYSVLSYDLPNTTIVILAKGKYNESLTLDFFVKNETSEDCNLVYSLYYSNYTWTEKTYPSIIKHKKRT